MTKLQSLEEAWGASFDNIMKMRSARDKQHVAFEAMRRQVDDYEVVFQKALDAHIELGEAYDKERMK